MTRHASHGVPHHGSFIHLVEDLNLEGVGLIQRLVRLEDVKWALGFRAQVQAISPNLPGHDLLFPEVQRAEKHLTELLLGTGNLAHLGTPLSPKLRMLRVAGA